MKKLLLFLFLFQLGLAYSAPYPEPTLSQWMQAQWKQHNGIQYVRVPLAVGSVCFARSTDSLISKSDEWEYLAPAVGAAIIPSSLEQMQVCTDTVPVTSWKVAPNPAAVDIPPTRPLKDAMRKDRWRILVGMPCEDATINVINTKGSEYHYATNSDGQRGETVCVKQ